MTITELPAQLKSADAGGPPHIAAHIALPDYCLWPSGGMEGLLIERIFSTALKRRALLVGKINVAVYKRQVLALATVTTRGVGLATIAEELTAVELIQYSHTPFYDEAEGFWRGDRPQPEPVPFQTYIDEFKAFLLVPAATREALVLEASQRVMFLVSNIAARKQTEPPAPQ